MKLAPGGAQRGHRLIDRIAGQDKRPGGQGPAEHLRRKRAGGALPGTSGASAPASVSGSRSSEKAWT